ncbi:MAG: hypothetical protein AAF204_01430 [Pseudomonadota bacterium]
MIHRVFLLLILVGVWTSSVAAQELFIRPGGNAAESSDDNDAQAPAIFNQPQTRGLYTRTPPSSIKYSDKLEVRNQQVKTASLMRTLEYWRESNATPTNGEEILMYADANRAVIENLAYQRREALLKHLEKKERAYQDDIVALQKQVYEASLDKSTSADEEEVAEVSPDIQLELELKEGVNMTNGVPHNDYLESFARRAGERLKSQKARNNAGVQVELEEGVNMTDGVPDDSYLRDLSELSGEREKLDFEEEQTFFMPNSIEALEMFADDKSLSPLMSMPEPRQSRSNSTSRPSRVFIQSDDDKAKPSKIFNNYR